MWMRLVLSGPQPARNSLRTRCKPAARTRFFKAAMERLSMHWRHPGTPMHRLQKPSWALRFTRRDPLKPRLSDMATSEQCSLRFTALFRRIMRGRWLPKLWETEMGTSPQCAADDLARDIGLNYRKKGEVVKGSPSLCLPVVGSMVNVTGRRGPYQQRSYLSAHKNGYIRVNLGTDEEGKPVQVYLHTLICMAFKGAPEQLEDGRYQQVSHLCGNPWCINHRHMKWSDHKGNLDMGLQDPYLEQRHENDVAERPLTQWRMGDYKWWEADNNG